jgi:hypothetical protein
MTAPFKTLFFSAVLACGLALTSQAAPMRVRGVALNATAMKPASGLALELIRPNAEASSGSLVGTTRTDAQGRFDFGPREAGADDLLLVRAVHGGYGYLATAYDGGSRLKDFGVTAKPEQTQVTVYESTAKPPKLTFQVHHLAIESSAQGIKVIERIVVENPSKATYTGIGDKKGTVLLDLPKGARGIKMDPKIPGKLIQTSHGWMATTPIAPSAYTSRNPLAGPNAIIYEYFLDWPSSLPWARRVELSQKVLYPTNFLFVARKTEDRVLQVTSPRLSKDQEQELPIDGNTEVRVVNAIGRPMGDTPALKTDERIEIAVQREVNPLFWAFCAFLGAVALAVPLALRGAKRRPADDDQWEEEELPISPTPTPARAQSARTQSARLQGARAQGALASAASANWRNDARAQALIAEIAEMDAAAERGEAPDGHEELRAARKEQLVALAAQANTQS